MSEPGVPPTPPPTAPPPPSGQSANRGLMIVLSYLWILALVPLLMEKEDREVQWHAKHGIVLLVAELILWVALTIVSMILGMITGGLGCLLAPLTLIIWVGVLVVHILCIIKGVNGQRFIIPGISQYADRF